MRPKTTSNPEEAEVLALNALGFLAAEPDRLQRFMDLAGLDIQAIRASAAEPAFLGAVIDHLLADESLLLIFAEEQQMRPDRIASLRRKLPGAALDF
ncbi:DUF3572 domain-containing protein [Aestuariivirga sp.]|uniref:DUF3572 domain-containing protein n=1 Tax=Aestuariivirga sp. TaxID=2650926 RepID=UPI003BAD60B2